MPARQAPFSRRSPAFAARRYRTTRHKTDRAVEFTGLVVYHIRDGKIAQRLDLTLAGLNRTVGRASPRAIDSDAGLATSPARGDARPTQI